MAAASYFVFLLVLAPLAASSAVLPPPGPALIAETCKHTTVHKDLCLQILTNEPGTRTAHMVDLGGIAIRVAARNATATANFIEGLKYKVNSTEPAFEQCLDDCAEAYEDAIQQLDDSTAALSSKGYNDTVKWVNAAVAAVKTCQNGCHAVPEHKNVLTKRNGDVEKLCSIVGAIAKHLSYIKA